MKEVYMKKIFTLAALSAALIFSASCQKTAVNKDGNGYLSFSEFELELDETVVTKASPASGNYTIFVMDANDEAIITKTYSEVKNNENMIMVPAGDYTLVVRSTEEAVPTAAFEQPVYGVSKQFSIVAGEVTPIGELTCTLLQCKVTVDYNDDFLKTVTGPCSTKVELTAGQPLEYVLNQDGTYNRSAGYFAVSGNTLNVTFSGNIEGADVTMNKTFSGIEAKQWRQIKFIPRRSIQGTATFDIVIDDLVSDEELSEDLVAEETIIGKDPNAPEDDGGIKILLAEDCQSTIQYSEEDVVFDADGNQINCTALVYIPIDPMPSKEEDPEQNPTMSIKLKALVPAGVAELYVDIATNSGSFANAVNVANATHIDLVNPQCAALIFDVVDFPRGEQILNMTELNFDLSGSQREITAYSGTHVFTMTIVDANGKTKISKFTMFVE